MIGNNYSNLTMDTDHSKSINITAIDKIILGATIKCNGNVILEEYEELMQIDESTIYCSTILKGTNLTIIINKDIHMNYTLNKY